MVEPVFTLISKNMIFQAPVRGPFLILCGFEAHKKGFRCPYSGSSRNPWSVYFEILLVIYVLQLQHVFKCFFVQDTADIEGAEFAVTGADFVKTHFVDQLFKLKCVVGE